MHHSRINKKNKDLILIASVVTILADNELQNEGDELALLPEHFLHAYIVVISLILDHLVG
jgi:hypothetical protein